MAKNEQEMNLNHATSKKKKNREHSKKSKSDNKLYTDTLNMELNSRKPNDRCEAIFSHYKHQRALYVSNNNLAYEEIENSQTFASDGITKNKKSSCNGKRKNSELHNSDINGKSKCGDTTQSLQDSNGHTSDFENEISNTSSTKEDTELFFFDLSGNRSNSCASTSSLVSDVPAIGKKSKKASLQISSEKSASAESNSSAAAHEESRNSSYVEPVTDMRNSNGKAKNSECQVKGYDDRSCMNEIVDVRDRKKKKRNSLQTDLSRINETDENQVKFKKQNYYIDSILNRMKEKLNMQNGEVLNQDENTGLGDTSSTFKKPKKSKKHKGKTTVDIRDSECEMSFTDTDAAVPRKKTKKKTPIELNVSEEPNSEMSGLKLPKRSKKPREVEALVDIRDSDCEMSITDGALHEKKKKKKKKNIPVENDVPCQDGHVESDNVRKPNEEQSNFKFPKKLKKKRPDMLVDIRESDCEMSYTDVLFHKRKKKRKISTEAETLDEESTPKVKNRNALNDGAEPNNFKSPKRLKKKHSNILVDIRDSDCEMSVSSVSTSKKRKIMENEVAEAESTLQKRNEDYFDDHIQETNEETTSFKSSKKSKRRHSKILVDIRDSDCEMSVSGVSSPKKRKKKKVPIENEVLDAGSTRQTKNIDNFIGDIESDIAQETNEEPNGFKLPKKLKKKQSKILVDIRDSDCEMSVSGVSSPKKRKKKTVPIENEVLDAGSTGQTKNIDNFIGDIESENAQETNEEPNGFKLPKKLKKRQSKILVDIRDSDCEMSISDISSPKKKKKKRTPIDYVALDAESTLQVKNVDNFTYDIEYDKEPNEELDGSKSSKKLKKKRTEILVDIRDSDCEMSFNAASSPRKKKKKKILVEDEVPNTESAPKIKNKNEFNTPVELAALTNKELNSTKSDIKGSDRENSLSDVSIRKKKKKKNIIVEELSEEEKSAAITVVEVCNKDGEHDDTILNSSTNFSKKLKKNPTENLVDIKGSNCESFSDISFHKKKKRKKVCIENQLTDENKSVRKIKKEKYSNNNVVEHSDIVSDSIKPPKELMKKQSEVLADIRDIKGEMSSNNGTLLKNKKKKVVINGELSNQEKTFKSKNGGALNMDVDYNKENNILTNRNKYSETSEENAMSYNSEETKKKKNKYDNPRDDIFKRVGNTELKTLPGVKSEKVEVNCNDFKNSLVPICQTDEFPENGLSEYSLENSKHKKGRNSLEIRNQDLTSTEYNGRLLENRHNSVHTSSSEGYQSDDSELVSTSKNVMNNMATIIENNHNTDGIERLNGQKYIKTKANCTFNKESKIDVAECNKPLVNGNKCSNNEDQTSDDSVEVIDGPHSTKKYEAKEFKAEAEEDVKRKTTKWMTMKSKLAKEFVKSHGDKKNIDKDESYLLALSNDLKHKVNEDDIDTVRQLTVILPFTVSPLHSILTRTSTPSKEQLEQIKTLNLEVKWGPFSKEEDRIIINNFKRFYEDHNLVVNPSVFTSFPRRMKMSEKMQFLRYLAHGLDNRLLHRVYIRFKKLLQSNNLKSGRFSPKEDQDILIYINETDSGTPFRDLAEILNRSKESIIRRYYLLTSDQYELTVKWSPEMVDRLLKYMMKVTKCDKLKRLKRRKLTQREWKKLSKKMDVPILKLQRAWNITIYPRLFAKQNLLNELKKIKEDIIKTLYTRKEQDWRLVNWEEIAMRYKGLTPQKVYSMFTHLVSYHVPESMHKNLGDCLDFLVNEVLKRDKLGTTRKFKKFLYEQGRIVYKQESQSD